MIRLWIITLKAKLQDYQSAITKRELKSALLFLLMTVGILPWLPDRSIDPMGLINLYRIWIMVVLVAGISFFGYISIRLLGSTHGIGTAGLFGGLVSSTAVAMSMSRKIHHNPRLAKNLAIGITLASSMMLIRAGLEIWVVNPDLTHPFILPILLGSMIGFGYIILLYRESRKENVPYDITLKNPFKLKEALIMGLLFGVILALITLSNRHLGATGVYTVAFVSGITDIDAIVLSLSSLARNGLASDTAQYAILIAIVSNTLTKAGLVFFLGKIALFRYVAIYYLLSIGTFSLASLITFGFNP